MTSTATPAPEDLIAQGTASYFGGPKDTGVKPDEPLALLTLHDMFDERKAHLLLAKQPPGTTGAARRLNTAAYYLAYRFPRVPECSAEVARAVRAYLRENPVYVSSAAHPDPLEAWVVDWGPSQNLTDRDVDLSPGLMAALGVSTDHGEVWIWKHPSHEAPHAPVISPITSRPAPVELPADTASRTSVPTSDGAPLVQTGTTQLGVVGAGGIVSFLSTFKRFYASLTSDEAKTAAAKVVEGIHWAEGLGDKSGPEKKAAVLQAVQPTLEPLVDKFLAPLGSMGPMVKDTVAHALSDWIDAQVALHFPKQPSQQTLPAAGATK